MARYLIINADDYGMCNSANEAVEDLFTNGRLKSSTIMLPCPSAQHAVDFSIAHPEYAIGVHLTLTSEWKKYRWKPLTNGSTLIDEEGYMWHESEDVAKHASLKELEAEIRAQIDKAHQMGMKPSHIDNHMGSLYGHQTGRLSLMKMTLRVIGEYGYAYRLYTKAHRAVAPRGVPYPVFAASTLITKHFAKKYNVILPDYLLFPDWTADLRQSYEHYREEILKIWSSIPEGVTETFVHPAFDTDELKGITSLHKCRYWEYLLLNDEKTHEFLKEQGIIEISYRDLVAMKK